MFLSQKWTFRWAPTASHKTARAHTWMVRLCHSCSPHVFHRKQAAADRIHVDTGGALHPTAGITKDYLLAENKFFCHILDAQKSLIIKLWQIETGRARSCLAESRELEMPSSIHSHATNSAAHFGRVTSSLRPSIPHLQTRDDNVTSSVRGNGSRLT